MFDDLAIAVIEQAIEDLESPYLRVRKDAVNFLCGTTAPWRESLRRYVILANCDIDAECIMEYYRKKLGVKNGRTNDIV